jgi:uncharacterized protein YfaP (DUF2135 family)
MKTGIIIAFAFAGCAMLCAGCGSGTVDEDALARGLIIKIAAPVETVIVLTWEGTPEDLDSHLYGPKVDSGQFHVYWPDGSRRYEYEDKIYVDLDIDDRESYGKETTTIFEQINGEYTLSVHDYTNRDSSNSTALADSGAVIEVFRDTELVATYNVPDQAGTHWTVFKLNESAITPVNTMEYKLAP